MSWTMDPRKMPNGTVLFLGISYTTSGPAGDMRGRTAPKIYTYVALKMAGTWFFSGSGKVPQAAGWGAVERWLDRDNRKLEWVKIMSATEDVYPAPVSASPAPLALGASATHTTDREVAVTASLALNPAGADPFEHPDGAPCSDPWCGDKTGRVDTSQASE